ncbi:complex I NDUFA9 subunit family protein [Pacificimonas flava]|uniref:Complex I NDUFA9 subunit family protein n=2 Tax=Pacificimonas TaxID=1960290 RepID=A0A219B2R6_9SPHN|nr:MULTISPECIES: complex I NDUFA9 subunit family protein [Pacificimonas]MBZ6377695.1 complex I NDUFA9 subunit family protein [Pacificimonas aurantium]OWV32625.1 complex I NDUFA9 subunit family protein [Pacificimonas flava]
MSKLVTVFGAAGFIGRYVCQELAKADARIRAATRDPHSAQFLRPLAGLGQMAIVKSSLSAPTPACEGVDAVVNLVGILDESGQSFEAVHVDGARRAAEAAKEAGAKSFVQVSAIGADPEAEADYARTKGEGEAAVREVFPDATILRPSIVFGPEDEFLNRFAKLMKIAHVMPVVAGDARFQPVYVGDLAEAVAKAALDPAAHGGKIYELGGPNVVTMRELLHWIARTTGQDERFIEVPDAVTARMVKMFGWLPGAPMTQDQWKMLQSPNVVSGENGLSAFGISPTPMQAVAPNWMVHYRRHGRFTKLSEG